MAYKNLVNITNGTASRQEVFQRIRDFVCAQNGTYNYSTTGIGWTLFDSSYAVNANTLTNLDWIVIKSTGENGQESMYYKLIYYSASHIYVNMYINWNATTHTGSTSASTGGTWLLETAIPLAIWIYGDLNFFTVVAQTSASPAFTASYLGCLTDSFKTRSIQTVALALTAGSNVTFNIGTSTDPTFAVGRYIFVMGADKIERVLITANDSAGNITVGTLVNSHLAGAKVCSNFPYTLVTNATYPYYNADSTVIIGNDGVVPKTANFHYSGIMYSYEIPNSITGAYTACRVIMTDSSVTAYGYNGTVPNSITFSTSCTGLSQEMVLTTQAGSNYRFFTITNATLSFMGYLEV